MAVQQIGLGCKSSKKSLSTKAAHFSNANAVYFFLHCFFFLPLSLLAPHLPVVRRSKTSFHFTENTLTGAYLQRRHLILALRMGQL